VIDGYLGATQQGGQMVFDGLGPANKEAFSGIRRLDIVFAGSGQDADGVIEGKILVDSAPKRLIVVSNDRALREAATHRKAKAVSCEDFWEQVQTNIRRNKPKRKEPPEKRQGLSEGETDQWLDLFGLD